MPSLYCTTPHVGLAHILQFLQLHVFPQWLAAGVFTEIDTDPQEGVSATHKLILVDLSNPEPVIAPVGGVICYWYFTPSAVLPTHTYQHLDHPHMGIASSGMLVGALLHSLPPSPAPALYTRVRLLRAVPLIAALPTYTPFSERRLGVSREQLRSKRLGTAYGAKNYVLVVADGLAEDPYGGQPEIVELIVRLKTALPDTLVVIESRNGGTTFDSTVLDANELRDGRDFVIFPNTAFDPDFYQLFDAAVGVTGSCYFPLSLVAAATCGIPTFAPDVHVWAEAITHMGAAPIPVTFFSKRGDSYGYGADIGALATALGTQLQNVNFGRRALAKTASGKALGAEANSSLLTLFGLI